MGIRQTNLHGIQTIEELYDIIDSEEKEIDHKDGMYFVKKKDEEYIDEYTEYTMSPGYNSSSKMLNKLK